MHIDYVSGFADAAVEVLEAIPTLDMRARIPACPRWSTYDLLVHLGNVHAWAATVVETGQRAPHQDDHPASRRPGVVRQWYAGKAGDLLQVLRDADPAATTWTFSARHDTAAFWLRRQLHETLVHLVDLRQAGEGAPRVAPELAADGVDEVLDVFLGRMHARGRPAELSVPVLLEATDTGDLWLVTPADGDAPPDARRVSGADLVDRGVDLVSALASDLLLLLWKRLDVESSAVRLDGDPERLRAFLRSPLTP